MKRHSDDISHEGRIIAIDSQVTSVQIVSQSACSSCHAKGLCSLGESKEKIVDLPTTVGNWSVGQEVMVFVRKTMGFKAVWVAYVVPLLVLVAVLLVSLAVVGASELTAGLCAIASVAVYYLLIWLLRDRLKNEYTFYIKEK